MKGSILLIITFYLENLQFGFIYFWFRFACERLKVFMNIKHFVYKYNVNLLF